MITCYCLGTSSYLAYHELTTIILCFSDCLTSHNYFRTDRVHLHEIFYSHKLLLHHITTEVKSRRGVELPTTMREIFLRDFCVCLTPRAVFMAKCVGNLSDEDMTVDKGKLDFIYSFFCLIFFNDADPTRMIGVFLSFSRYASSRLLF